MSGIIRKAELKDIETVSDIYSRILTEEEEGRVSVGWARGVYPTEKTAEEALTAGDLFVLCENEQVVAAARINQVQVPEYADAVWQYNNVANTEIMVLHTLVVDPRYGGKGYGRQFVAFYEQYALNHNCCYLRMDTNVINRNARRLYADLGYNEADTVSCVFNGIPDVRLVCLEKRLKKNDFRIRPVCETDAGKLLEIYRPYVEKTAVSFEYKTPDIQEFRNRIAGISSKYPYLVAEINGETVGYAYALELKSREAYSKAAETTVYVRNDCRQKGIGKSLYKELEEKLKQQGILNMYACIAYAETEDEFLTNGSRNFHQKMGFQKAGVFHKCGFKFGRWYDILWMEKIIGEHSVDTENKR